MCTLHGGHSGGETLCHAYLAPGPDGRGRLEYGEAVDTEARSQGQFVGWRGLTRTVRSWLTRQEESGG